MVPRDYLSAPLFFPSILVISTFPTTTGNSAFFLLSYNSKIFSYPCPVTCFYGEIEITIGGFKNRPFHKTNVGHIGSRTMVGRTSKTG